MEKPLSPRTHFLLLIMDEQLKNEGQESRPAESHVWVPGVLQEAVTECDIDFWAELN
jgi:hypothetical protein